MCFKKISSLIYVSIVYYLKKLKMFKALQENSSRLKKNFRFIFTGKKE